MGNQPERQNDPNALWKMIDEKDKELYSLRERVTKGHWYTGYTQVDAWPTFQWSCNCGYINTDSKAALQSHIDWFITKLQAQGA